MYCRDFEHAEALLASHPSLFDLRNSIGETVLHFLAVENELEAVAWLFARGFSLKTQNTFGTPMVFEVAGGGHRELLLWLARHGADLSAVDRKNQTLFAFLRRPRDVERRRRGEEMIQCLAEHFPELSLGFRANPAQS